MQKEFGIHMKGGVITERDPDLSTIRIRAPAGILTIEQLRGIAKIAKKYGSGVVHCTTRQTIEIPHVNPNLLKRLAQQLEKNGTPVGSEKDEVVNIISCPGTERCKYANIDTISLAKRIDEKLFGKEMPVKMRIALSGCPNGCTSPMLNEIGIIGRIRPIRTPGLCTGCGSCVYYCKEKAIKIRNGISELNEEKCVQCGMCVKSCSFNLLKVGTPPLPHHGRRTEGEAPEDRQGVADRRDRRAGPLCDRQDHRLGIPPGLEREAPFRTAR